MRLLSRGRQLGQAVKNVQRLRQILGVFAKYGFADVVERVDLARFLPRGLAAIAAAQSDLSTPERLRLSFEELGPTFVKLGQLLSTRPDLLPQTWIDELTKLQDQVPPMPGAEARAAVERELKRPISEAFAEFSDAPIAAASIGQVHAATLPTGEKVVVKVQRPEIQRIIDTDVSLLAFLAGLLERYVPEVRVVGPRNIVDEYFRTLAYELDFVVEANNMTKIARNLAEFPDVVVPKVFKALSTRRVLTLERLEGLRVNDLAALDAAGVDRKRVVELGARAFFKTVMLDGLFHGDLHGGNLFILPPREAGGAHRLGIIDFGIVGRLSERARDQLAAMVMALITEDYETLCYQYAELGQAGPSIDFDGFQRETRNALSPHLGLSLREINLGRILIEATKIATKYRIQVPGDWMIVFKALLTMEGMGRTLDPEFDMLALGEELVGDLARAQYSPQRMGRELMFIARDLTGLLQVLPRQLRWMFRKFNRDDFAFDFRSKDLEAIREQLDASSRRQAAATIAVGFAIAGALALQQPMDEVQSGRYPPLAVALTAVGGLALIRLLTMRK